MKTHLFTLALAAALLLPAHAATVSFPDVPTVREQAKAEEKPWLVLWHGSNWMAEDASAALCSEWTKLARQTENPLPVLFAQYDEKVGLTEEERNAAAMPFPEFNLPIAILFAPDGTYMATYRGKTLRSAAEMQAAVSAQLEQLPLFTELLTKMRESQGVESVLAAGRALDLLPLKDALRHEKLVNLIRERDPEDSTGYASKYAINHIQMFGKINTILKGGQSGQLSGNARRFAEAETFVRSVIERHKGTQPELGIEQQQQWLAGLYYIQKERMLGSAKKDRTEVLDTLEKLIRLDPKTEYAKGAAVFHRYWNPKSFFVVENAFYEPMHMTLGFEKDWHVDVTDQVNGPGRYTVSIVPTVDNALSTRNFRLIINGREVARPETDPAQSTRSVEIDVPELPRKAKVEIWLTAQCHDGWLNCFGRIVVKKT